MRKAELTCCVWLLGASGLYSWGSPVSCAHRRGFSLPRTLGSCHSCVGTGTQPWVLPYKTRCCYRAICFGDQDVVVLVPSPVQSRWNRVAVGAGSSSSRCSWWVLFFSSVFGCFEGAMDNGRGVLVVDICPFAGFLCFWLFYICQFWGVNAPVELLGDVWCSP